jgi:hypothetical protein
MKLIMRDEGKAAHRVIKRNADRAKVLFMIIPPLPARAKTGAPNNNPFLVFNFSLPWTTPLGLLPILYNISLLGISYSQA